MNNKFTKVNLWSWETFFSGCQHLYCNINVTKEEVEALIEKTTKSGGGGNYKKESLKSKTVKVKTKDLVVAL